MAVYVDELATYPTEIIAPAAQRWGNDWCHLVADSLPELLAFARKLRLSASYMQRGGSGKWAHFDLTPGKRAEAIRKGAIPVKASQLVAGLKYGVKIVPEPAHAPD